MQYRIDNSGGFSFSDAVGATNQNIYQKSNHFNKAYT